jgi:hypothetical protein
MKLKTNLRGKIKMAKISFEFTQEEMYLIRALVVEKISKSNKEEPELEALEESIDRQF